MVLQQESTLPVWGWSDAGERILVSFAGQQVTTTAGSDGRWRVDLAPLPAGTPGGRLIVSGKNTLTFSDVIVGDVWICSGQSNMEFRLRTAHNAKEEIPRATDAQIRLCHVETTIALAPRTDAKLSWAVCSPESAAPFSAIGYFFAKDLRIPLQRPIGMIDSTLGATPAQAWTDLGTLAGNPVLRHYAEALGRAASRGDANKKTPSVLFNGMIAPLIPFAIKGVIWYQGEDNADDDNGGGPGTALEYRTLFPAMITGWRKQWGQGDFPFLFVQLTNLANRPKAKWPLVREAQLKSLAVSRTGMAVIIDLGVARNIHPPDKADVAYRLSLAARHVAYRENLVYTGPMFEGMEVEGDRIRISFTNGSLGGGLVIGHAPWIDPSAAPISSTELQGFAVAGEDRKWAAGEARIDGPTIVVSSPRVPAPVAVRYAWADSPTCNLYNRAGLPASPFRTDDWNDQPPNRSLTQ